MLSTCVSTPSGGFQCVSVSCPSSSNAESHPSLRLTNQVLVLAWVWVWPCRRCEKNLCMQGDQGCLQAPNVLFVSNMSTPQAHVLRDMLRFALVGGRGHSHFSVQRSGRQTGTLLLVKPIGVPPPWRLR